MFDPYDIGTIEATDIVKWIPVTDNITHAILVLQGKQHAVLLKQTKNYKDEQLVADRIKFMCALEPMYVCTLQIPKVDIHQKGISSNPIKYFMIYTEFRYSGEVEFVKCPNITNIENPDNFEICKILLFRFMIGAKNTTEEHIIVRNHKYVSISENVLCNGKLNPTLVNKYMMNDELLWRARKAITENFDFDCLRGIICGTRQEEREIVRTKKIKLNIDYKSLIALIECNLEIIASVSCSELRAYLVK